MTDTSQTNEIIGQVKSVKQGYLKILPGSLIVKDTEGRKHLIKASSKSLEGIRAGDSVEVKAKNGKAKFIIKLSRRIIINKYS
ncbi:MAG: hypothetical protein HYW01_01885 [Deltaproteobacteria bacterium]|nr:hypothetical protein [Deltaproteobacteria bacterium]